MNAPVAIPPRACAAGIKRFEKAQPLAANAWQFDWQFAADDRAFDGHFPHQPILAGVFLMEMAQQAAEYALANARSEQRRVVRVDRFRFHNPILPGDGCTLRIEWPETVESTAALPVKVAFSKGGEKVAQGRLTLGVAGQMGTGDAS